MSLRSCAECNPELQLDLRIIRRAQFQQEKDPERQMGRARCGQTVNTHANMGRYVTACWKSCPCHCVSASRQRHVYSSVPLSVGFPEGHIICWKNMLCTLLRLQISAETPKASSSWKAGVHSGSWHRCSWVSASLDDTSCGLN